MKNDAAPCGVVCDLNFMFEFIEREFDEKVNAAGFGDVVVNVCGG